VGAPKAVLDAAHASLDACGRGETTLGYTVADGTDALRGRIAQFYKDRYGVTVDEDAVMVTTGSSAAFVLAGQIVRMGTRHTLNLILLIRVSV